MLTAEQEIRLQVERTASQQKAILLNEEQKRALASEACVDEELLGKYPIATVSASGDLLLIGRSSVPGVEYVAFSPFPSEPQTNSHLRISKAAISAAKDLLARLP